MLYRPGYSAMLNSKYDLTVNVVVHKGASSPVLPSWQNLQYLECTVRLGQSNKITPRIKDNTTC